MAGRPKGLPKTGGRQPGGKNKRTRYIERKVAETGLTPRDYLLSVMRDATQELMIRVRAAESVAPYIHARLATIQNTHSGPDGGAIAINVNVSFLEVSHAPD